jgi:hydrogenase maturation protein HypF
VDSVEIAADALTGTRSVCLRVYGKTKSERVHSRPDALKLKVTGVVQGVGFRPFVYGLAADLQLAGYVCNTSAGVDIEIEGSAEAMGAFVAALTSNAPPLARIDNVTIEATESPGYTEFSIRQSRAQTGAFQPISPDICICDECLSELFDPKDRRYHYPFINCTNCGPRFTIIQDVPYDRPNTTMAPFELCPDCLAEYQDPRDRRFHAQPNACPVCGPHVELWIRDAASSPFRPKAQREEAITAARTLLDEGRILAVKGLGGFHLACDATNEMAVERLRERKGRVDKPFALMVADLATVMRCCHATDEEIALLTSRERPIVLLRERDNSPVSSAVAPGNADLGMMLPYTPLHYLLLEPGLQTRALVMTSGNYSEEPIATDNEEALDRLSALTDGFLFHNRDIQARCDDSVTRFVLGTELPIRRSRGYAPYPVHLPWNSSQILAVGGELKNTFCLTKDHYAFLSQHIGDLENYETLQSFQGMVEQLKRTFRVTPEIIAYDLHPAYLSTQYAKVIDPARKVAVQHHHAHIAACMSENGLDSAKPVIGVAFDGTGYGSDGAIWGGEFLVATYDDFRRAAHLAYIPLPGGDAAIRNPYRTALAHLWAAGVDWDDALAPVRCASPTERGVIARQIESRLNTAPTSSMGRLFDAVAAIAGVRQTVTYEAQAAIELEMLVEKNVDDEYSWEIAARDGTLTIDASPVIRGAVTDVRAGLASEVIAARFHNSVASLVAQICAAIRQETGLKEVALSGGVWQNVTLLTQAAQRLQMNGFTVFTHHLVPPNDGGLALGQAAVAHFQSDSCSKE